MSQKTILAIEYEFSYAGWSETGYQIIVLGWSTNNNLIERYQSEDKSLLTSRYGSKRAIVENFEAEDDTHVWKYFYLPHDEFEYIKTGKSPEIDGWQQVYDKVIHRHLYSEENAESFIERFHRSPLYRGYGDFNFCEFILTDSETQNILSPPSTLADLFQHLESDNCEYHEGFKGMDGYEELYFKDGDFAIYKPIPDFEIDSWEQLLERVIEVS